MCAAGRGFPDWLCPYLEGFLLAGIANGLHASPPTKQCQEEDDCAYGQACLPLVWLRTPTSRWPSSHTNAPGGRLNLRVEAGGWGVVATYSARFPQRGP